MVGVAIFGMRKARRGVGYNALCLDPDTLSAGLLLIALDAVQAAAITCSSGLLPLGQRMDWMFEGGVGACVANLVLVADASRSGPFSLTVCLCRRGRESVKHEDSVVYYIEKFGNDYISPSLHYLFKGLNIAHAAHR